MTLRYLFLPYINVQKHNYCYLCTYNIFYTVATLPESIASEHHMPANLFQNTGIFYGETMYMCVYHISSNAKPPIVLTAMQYCMNKSTIYFELKFICITPSNRRYSTCYIYI